MTTTSLRGLAKGAVLAISPQLWETLKGVKRAIKNRHGAKQVFAKIYQKNGWDGTDSVSRPRSSHYKTRLVKERLPPLLQEFNVKTLLDLPCGDMVWIKECLPEGITYVGGDIVPGLIADNHVKHASLGTFKVLDLITDPLPAADMILVRDCLIHLPNTLAKIALGNVKMSRIRYLLTTSYLGVEKNLDIEIGGFRQVNLQRAPFNLPAPADYQRVRERSRRGRQEPPLMGNRQHSRLLTSRPDRKEIRNFAHGV